MNFIAMLFTVLLFIFAVYGVNYYKTSFKTYIYIFLTITILLIFLFEKYEQYLLPIALIIIFIFLYSEIKSMHAAIITCISAVILFISNSVIGMILLSVLDITVDVFRGSTLLYIFSCILGGIFVLLVGYPFRKFAIKHIKNYNFTLKHKAYLYMILLLILTLSIFYVTIILFSSSNQKLSQTQLIIETVLCLGYSILLFLIFNALVKSLRSEYEIKAKAKEYEDIKEYTENLENLYNEMRGFRHDYINILSSMNGYIETKDIDGLSKYFNKNIIKMNEQLEKRNSQIGVLQNIKIPEIKGLISSKIIKAQEMNIDVAIEVPEEIDLINIDVVHLCRILGILLDNAIEELHKCTSKKMRFGIIKKDNKVLIVVCNECSESVAPIFKIFKRGFSTKGENRGIGLSNLKDILNLYPKITLETKIINNEFIQCIEV